MRRGDVVLVDFPFSSGVGGKVRPALVIHSDLNNQRLLNTIVAMHRLIQPLRWRCDIDPHIVLKLGIEGGGIRVWRESTAGDWLYWSSTTSMDFDDNDDEVWREHKTPASRTLVDHLPSKWILFQPTFVHPDVVAQLRALQPDAVAQLVGEDREWYDDAAARVWQEALELNASTAGRDDSVALSRDGTVKGDTRTS